MVPEQAQGPRSRASRELGVRPGGGGQGDQTLEGTFLGCSPSDELGHLGTLGSGSLGSTPDSPARPPPGQDPIPLRSDPPTRGTEEAPPPFCSSGPGLRAAPQPLPGCPASLRCGPCSPCPRPSTAFTVARQGPARTAV